jgi:histidinol-phosphatase (PHP family)
MFYDNHNHSEFSFDGGHTSVERAASEAASKGLGGLCFTDHCDFTVPEIKAELEPVVCEVFDVEAQQAEIDRVKEKMKGRIRLFKGIEVGLNIESRDKIRGHLASHSFDEVIASVHYLDGHDPWMGPEYYYKGKTFKEAYGHYLECMYEEMTWLGDFDIMGHYDYIARYASYPEASVMYRDFPDIFDAMFKYLAENGKALEINTKSYGLDRGTILDPNVLTRFRELGGEAVSLGSDSHEPERVGTDFERFAAVVRDAGFRYLAHFEQRRLVMEKI